MNQFQRLAYRFGRPFLFKLDPEDAHHAALTLARWMPWAIQQPIISRPTRVLGIDFTNPLGLAAGFDKNGDSLQTLENFGFGFIELGSVTPVAQAGNPRPRIKRFTERQALVNHMGLNNLGVEHLAKNLERYQGLLGLGASFSQNTATPLGRACEDYEICFERLYGLSDYLVADVSCPSTGHLESASRLDFLEDLITRLRERQKKLSVQKNKYTPLLFKLSCDWNRKLLEPLAERILKLEIDGVICGNTSVDPEIKRDLLQTNFKGGVSGTPVFPKALELVRVMRQLLGNQIAVIGVGGISKREDLWAMQEAGAQLCQIYTALIYQGPQVVREILYA